jgi:uncharacterized protein
MIKYLVLKLIKIYQKSSFLKKAIFKTFLLNENSCCFYPTCSEYCYQAILKYGIINGSLRGLRRIFKCHPFSKGGVDLVK